MCLIVDVRQRALLDMLLLLAVLSQQLSPVRSVRRQVIPDSKAVVGGDCPSRLSVACVTHFPPTLRNFITYSVLIKGCSRTISVFHHRGQ